MSLEIQEDCVGISVNPTLIDSSTNEPNDLTTATSVVFRFLSPIADSVALEVNGSIDGDPTLGKVIYTSTDDEFSEPGTWKYQVKVTLSGGIIFYSKVSKIKVKANI